MSESEQEQLAFWPSERIAAIDIGSNSVRIEIAQVDTNGGYRVLDEERENTRLASELGESGRLSDESIEKTLTALKTFLLIGRGYGVKQVRAIATSAVRDALNGDAFRQRVAHEVGLDIDVIAPREEARLAFLSVARAFDVSDKQVGLADIGGGSTEIVLASSGHIDVVYATRLGAVRVAERCGLSAQCNSATLRKAAEFVDRRLKKCVGKPSFVPSMLYGTGGTFTALASMLAARSGDDDRLVRGYRVKRVEVRHLLSDLARMPLEKRHKVPGLNPKRADIIVSGLLVVERIMRRLQVNLVQVHSRGVRDGVLLTMIEGSPNRVATPDERMAAVESFAISCGVDRVHARQVARIAGNLVDQLAEPLGLDAADRPLIVAAAYLANVGYLINYDKHHKHSYHLILNSDLRGFERQELRLLANVARYHRGAAPKQRHKNFAMLSHSDQQRVAKMAAILRLGLALDRTHRQQVEGIHCVVLDDQVEIEVTSQGDAEVDLWAARRKGDLFERVFSKRLIFSVKGNEERISAGDDSKTFPSDSSAFEEKNAGVPSPKG